MCVFTVQYTEVDLKTRKEYLALVPGKTLSALHIGVARGRSGCTCTPRAEKKN